jgi:antitoxin (DNA-binding transcriptional repressor) of toxin-antitoxin stability system
MDYFMEHLIPIGQLKTHCYQILEEINNKNEQVVITKRGTPIATIKPINEKSAKKIIFGLLQAQAQINNDIINLNVKWNAENE